MPAQRPLEDGIVQDFKVNLSYGEYLRLDAILTAQNLVSVPGHHDELLFIIQHQTSELWLKLVIHELRAVQQQLAKDELRPALKGLARVKHIQRTLTEQWSVLATLTPSEYAEFRSFLGTSSGFQSYQYRAIEFLLGNKDRRMLKIFDDQPEARALLEDALATPSVYDEFLHFLARRGHPVPAEILQRDVTEAWDYQPTLLPVFREIYERAEQNWDVYEACEELVDLEENFQFWRFRHLKTVERTIGFKRGTGGSSGVSFLKAALDLTFFPELYAVRTEIAVPS
ncbi:putative tryptophan 2,3-dioxygenase [Actinoplanes missouriensis 431]|uniref:Tryptophan 2,3-dioxygenase n=1 Tax=Actinoplanes missouriensis (strain ATCC 14538 / DSM 43046 / CBS 188.64 / JCM 3121 / NBRC 102363 / NCIMB 12654 / NRRL B-3342 / UNCC 431) TaxID=512565 RepID=I0HFL8_ACTM4|nr:tryptophan 2,3-dioxygenase family protein [Actinoplanes missouriensis]BAL91805.1 putative tryptophan 2,3-dioxygenase [Actinoplanes missouriensis 431]